MDKYEYKLRSAEIKSLIAERDFVKAVEIADTIDWTRVRSVSMLCTISDLYKVNRRYREAKEILTQAYERYPNGRTILYSLCELCIKTDDIVRAIEYYKAFVQLAPTDNGKFVLQYKIYEAQDVSLEERIAVLEELKKRDYREKWGYELAYLYHRIGLTTRCVEECDELIIWFRDGRYVKKAMELKMLHQPLTPEQEVLYKGMLPEAEKKQYEDQTRIYDSSETAVENDTDLGKTKEVVSKEDLDIHIKPVDVSKYNTVNLQKELAKGLKEVLVTDDNYEHLYQESAKEEAPTTVIPVEIPEEEENGTEEQTGEDEEQQEEKPLVEDSSVDAETEEIEEIEETEETEILEELEVANLPGRCEENSGEDVLPENVYKSDGTTKVEFINPAPEEEQLENTKEFEKQEQSPIRTKGMVEVTPRKLYKALNENDANMNNMLKDAGLYQEPEKQTVPVENAVTEKTQETTEEDYYQPAAAEKFPEAEQKMQSLPGEERPSIREVMEGKNYENETAVDMMKVNPPEEMGCLLSQEYNGQISMVVPEEEQVEKQITGQMNLEDILEEWEKTKKENEERRKQQTKERVLAQTGTLFTDFEARIRDGILEKLEKGEIDIESIKDEKSGVIANEVQEALNQDSSSEDNTSEENLEIRENIEEVQDDVETEDQDPAESQEEAAEQDELEDREEEVEERPVEDRELSEEEIELFAPFVQTKNARLRLMAALDEISLAANTGNVFVTGEVQEETSELAKNVIREVQLTKHGFSGKVAKVTGTSLNNRDLDSMIQRLNNGGLIIEKASLMDAQTAKNLLNALNRSKTGIVVVLQDTKKARIKMMEYFKGMKEIFNVHIEVEELGDDALVAYGKKYARHLEYSIDELGILALHTRIDRLQTADHAVTVADVRDIIDEAIENTNRKTFKHFTEILLAKRYDDEDMIILKERDFLN